MKTLVFLLIIATINTAEAVPKPPEKLYVRPIPKVVRVLPRSITKLPGSCGAACVRPSFPTRYIILNRAKRKTITR